MAEPPIDPEDWDVIVVGSGLAQCLIASAVAKAGSSVLLIDPEDTYGSESASFTLEALRQAALGASDVSLTAEPAAPGSAKAPAAPSAPAATSELAPGVLAVPLPKFKLPLHGVCGFALPSEAAHREAPGSYVLDLLPKMMYQAEPLVDLLLKCRAHHYLEFKRVEGSYIVAPGTSQPASSSSAAARSASPAASSQPSSSQYTLRPVPSSKSDIFKDRSMGLGEKRSLMGFLGAAVEAVQGGGRLKEALSSNTPLVEVLAAEGVPPALRDVILYGIAMSDSTQHAPDQSTQGSSTSASASQSVPAGAWPDTLTAREGADALQLLMESTARFGGQGAFMVPSWGCGSVPEAFVRCCAVAGGTTVLRCRGAAVLLARSGADEGREEGQRECEGPEGAHASIGAGASTHAFPEASAAAGDDHPHQKRLVPESIPAASAAGGGSWRVEGVVTGSGQTLTCKRLVAGADAMWAVAHTLAGAEPTPPAPASSPLPSEAIVHRALIITDKPLVPGQCNLTFLFPPASPVLEGSNTQPIRGLQLGFSLGVCPTGRYLVYLSTQAHPSEASLLAVRSGQGHPSSTPSHASRCSNSAAFQALKQAVELLVHTDDLQPLVPEQPAATISGQGAPTQGPQSTSQEGGQGEAGEATTGAVAPAPTAGGEDAGSIRTQGPGQAQETTSKAQGPGEGDGRPRALQVFYYTQHLPAGPPHGALPSNAACAAAPSTASSLGLLGHLGSVKEAEAAFRSHFPGLAWLSELDPADSGGEIDDDDADAIDELQAALGNLSADASASPSA